MTLAATLLATTVAPGEEPSAAPAVTTTTPAATPPAATTAAPTTPAPAAEPSEDPLKRPHRAHKEGTPRTAYNPLTNPVRWNPSWPKFRTAEVVTTGVMGITVFAALAIPPEPDRWREIGDFDAGARKVLRLDSHGARNTARDASDLVLTLMINQLVVDAALVAWWGHDRPSVATEMIAMDLEALAVAGGIQALVSGFASRWRPYRATCVGPEETQTSDCRDNKEFRSFFSGHTVGAFTAAGLMCSHHMNLPLYGGGPREAVTCAASFAAATTVGMLRVISDQHFLSDALVGAAVGTMTGLGLPYLLHYRGGAEPTKSGVTRPRDQVSIRLTPMPMGIAASGEF